MQRDIASTRTDRKPRTQRPAPITASQTPDEDDLDIWLNSGWDDFDPIQRQLDDAAR